MKRALVTGGCGFVGANLVRRLLTNGHEVHLLVRPQSDPYRISDLQLGERLHYCDLADAPAVVAAVRPQWVFHLAACGNSSWQQDADAMIATNVLGTLRLLEACAGVEAFVYAGSSSEYGFQDHAAAEDERIEPNSMYAVTKAGGTHLCQYMARSQQVNAVVLRPYSVFGPYEHPDRLIPTLVVQGRQGRLPPLVEPTVAHDFVYVDDVCSAFVLAAESAGQHRGQVYNVGSGVQTTLAEVVAVARDVLHIQQEPIWSSMPNRVWDSRCWMANIEKIQRELGWAPTVSFADGFEKTAALYVDKKHR